MLWELVWLHQWASHWQLCVSNRCATISFTNSWGFLCFIWQQDFSCPLSTVGSFTQECEALILNMELKLTSLFETVKGDSICYNRKIRCECKLPEVCEFLLQFCNLATNFFRRQCHLLVNYFNKTEDLGTCYFVFFACYPPSPSAWSQILAMQKCSLPPRII